MKCKKQYRDKEKYRKYHNNWSKRYYGKTEKARNKGKRWNEEEMRMLLEKTMPDRELSNVIGRSMKAIQIKRTKLIYEHTHENRADNPEGRGIPGGPCAVQR